jgi:uncharacterized membrane protein
LNHGSSPQVGGRFGVLVVVVVVVVVVQMLGVEVCKPDLIL